MVLQDSLCGPQDSSQATPLPRGAPLNPLPLCVLLERFCLAEMGSCTGVTLLAGGCRTECIESSGFSCAKLRVPLVAPPTYFSGPTHHQHIPPEGCLQGNAALGLTG